jgi:MoaA/NifB/PqqE/SkfB family radical SAM enzyme
MTVEFTTRIGCPVACLKYCPQEVIAKNYQGEKNLSLEKFKKYLEGIPKDQTIIFSGLSEPFTNPECVDMIEHTYKNGYKVWMFSTLVGLSPKDAERVAKIPFDRFCLHLPDADMTSRIPLTPEYAASLMQILGGVRNIEFMNMGGLFHSNHTDEFVRRKQFQKKVGGIWCDRLDYPQYNVLPNGDVYFCCILNRFAFPRRQASAVIGNLNETTISNLMIRFTEFVKELQHPDSPCRTCPTSETWWKKKLIERILPKSPERDVQSEHTRCMSPK